MFERKDEKTGRKEQGEGKRERKRAEAERCERVEAEREEAENSLLRESEQQPAYTRLYLCRYEGGGREKRDSFPARSMMHVRTKRKEILSPMLARRVAVPEKSPPSEDPASQPSGREGEGERGLEMNFAAIAPDETRVEPARHLTRACESARVTGEIAWPPCR